MRFPKKIKWMTLLRIISTNIEKLNCRTRSNSNSRKLEVKKLRWIRKSINFRTGLTRKKIGHFWVKLKLEKDQSIVFSSTI
jgi:hypothetical protein